MIRRLVVFVGSVLCASPSLDAQIVETPQGVVEFIGLERWSIEMIRDSMALHAPDAPLGQCAAVLRQLGFVSASASLREGPDGRRRTIVTVVEPHRAERIQLRNVTGDSLPNASEWTDGIVLLRDQNQAFQSAIQLRGAVLQQDSATLNQFLPLDGDRRTHVEAFWRFLDDHRGTADLEQALHTLANDRNRMNAALAAAILTNFPEDPRAWRALMDAHRDSREYVAATASQAMRGLILAGQRTVDWKPMAPSIRALLDGTNVFVLDPVLRALVSTEVAPELASPLLRAGGADLVLARLRASDVNTRRSAHAFLVQISGEDFGEDVHAWAGWIGSL